MSDEYQRDRDEVLQHVRGKFLPVLQAMDEALDRDRAAIAHTDQLEPKRVYCRGFVAGMEYQKLIGKVQE